jgi:restriction system protein
MERMWMVRGDSGRLFEDFRERSVVAIGWHELVEVAKPGVTRDELARAYSNARPEFKRGTIISGASQVWRFVNEVARGDKVVTYHPSARRYLVGTIVGDLVVDRNPSESGMSLLRATQWLGEVERDELSVTTENSLGSTLTLFLVPPTAASNVLHAVSRDSSFGGGAAPATDSMVAGEAEEDESRDLLQDMEARSIEFIKDKVSALDWDEMQELIAGVLRAMGYKTRVAPPGPDRGADIVASPDGLGFENPRIVVEVKHRTGPMGSKGVRSFLGGRHKDDRGLYVSTGGFSKDSRYEADRAGIPLTLWELDDVVRALVDYYDKLDSETQQLVPLKRLYWPA